MSNIVNVYDNDKKTNLLKQVYSRYAVQMAKKGKAYWLDSSSIVLGKPKHTILMAFPKVGYSLSSADAVAILENIFVSELYPKKKAIGSLGGASSSKFLAFDCTTKLWKRIR